MFYIVNNKIHISKGETPTYNANILDVDGAPYRISSGLGDVVISFTVRESIWQNGDNYAFKLNSIYVAEDRDDLTTGITKVHVFDDTVLESYNDLYAEKGGTGTVQWDNAIIPDEITGSITTSKLYKLTDSNNNSTYRYYDLEQLDDGSIYYNWVEYALQFGFTFPYTITKDLENKTYHYDIAMYAGTLKTDITDGFPLDIIDYKKQLLVPTDFIVGGSLNE